MQRGWIWSRSVLWQNPGQAASDAAAKVASSWPLQQGLPCAAAPILHDFPSFDQQLKWFLRGMGAIWGLNWLYLNPNSDEECVLSKFNGGARFGSPVLVRHGSLVEAGPFGPAPARGAHGPKKTGRFSSNFQFSVDFSSVSTLTSSS